ncbi:MAG: alpha/beta hydrolase [Phycisphaerales bacterium]|nr:alpha/beta hydrolase [Phycisphaerales bacterium]
MPTLAQIEHTFAWPGLVQLLAVGLVLAVLIAAVYAGWALTHPPRRTYASAVARARPGDPSELPSPRVFESWTFTTGGATLPVWDIPGDNPAGPVVIMTHGWADGRLGALQRLGPVLPVASRIIAWDMRGHGDATGICRLGTREVDDLAALIEHLGASSVILFGWSLGGGVSIAAAARDDLSRRIAAVIAEAPYRVPGTPARRVMHVRGLPYRLNLPITFFVLGFLFGVGPRWRGFDRAAHARRLKCPLLVIHGEWDQICPVEDGRAIAEAAPAGSLAILADGGHNDLWVEEPLAARCGEVVREFLTNLTISGR